MAISLKWSASYFPLQCQYIAKQTGYENMENHQLLDFLFLDLSQNSHEQSWNSPVDNLNFSTYNEKNDREESKLGCHVLISVGRSCLGVPTPAPQSATISMLGATVLPVICACDSFWSNIYFIAIDIMLNFSRSCHVIQINKVVRRFHVFRTAFIWSSLGTYCPERYTSKFYMGRGRGSQDDSRGALLCTQDFKRYINKTY